MAASVATAEVVVCGACGQKNRVAAVARGVPRCGRCKAPLPWITEADDQTLDEITRSSTIPVLLDLWAPWCGPCRFISPALEDLARQYAGRVKLVKVNVDEAPQVSQRST